MLVIQVGGYLLVSHCHQRRDFFLNAGPFYGAASRLIDIVEQLGRGNRRKIGPMALVAALTAPLGLLGDTWWAKSNIEVRTLFDAGQLLKTE
jgi:hypothetical protein